MTLQLSNQSALSLQQFINLPFKCPYQLLASRASSSWKPTVSVIFCIHLSLQIWVWLFALNSEVDRRKVIEFQFAQLFSFCEVGNDGFQAFYKLEVMLEVNLLFFFLPTYS